MDSPQYWEAREREFRCKEEEPELIDDGFAIFVKERTLYHGSRTPGIKKLNLPADASSAGEGVYLTTAREAIGYAHGGRVCSEPTIYETRIRNAKLADLRNEENIERVNKEMETLLWAELERKDVPSWYPGRVRDDIDYLQGEATVFQKFNYAATKHPEILTKHVAGQGYDGLVTIEGGEPGHFENHQSWVIFDPDKVAILEEHAVSKREDSRTSNGLT